MKTLYANTCPAWHDTKKISKDKWLQNLRGEGMAGTARRVTYETTELQWHDTRNIVLQKINQIYCSGATVEPPDEPPDLLTDLLAYWKNEEGSGVTRQDAHTGNYDLTNNGATATGIISNGTRLAGTSGTTMENADAVFGLTGQMTIVGWVKLLQDTLFGAGVYLAGKQNRMSIEAGGFPTDGYMLYINTGGRIVWWQGNGSSDAEVDSDLIDVGINEWYFVVCGFNGTDQFIQINNGARNTVVGVTPTIGSQPLIFGGWKSAGSGSPLAGPDAIYDEFGIWTRVLSLDEASYLYNSGAGRTYPF